MKTNDETLEPEALAESRVVSCLCLKPTWATELFVPEITQTVNAMNTSVSRGTVIRKFIRKGMVGAIVGLFLATSCLPGVLHAGEIDSKPLGYSRDSIRAEQRHYGAQIQRAESELKAAQERLSVGLPSLAERNVILALLFLDAANVRMQGHEDRVAALRPAAFVYSRERQVQLLLATCGDLRSQGRRLEDSVHELRSRQPSGVTNTWKSLPVYSKQRADFGRRFKDQSLSPDDLIGDVQLLQGYPLSLVLGGLVNSKNHRAWTKSGDGTWRSPAGIEFLSDGSLKPANIAIASVSVTPKQNPAIDKAASALKKLEQKTSELDQAVSQMRRDQSNLVTGLATRPKDSPKENPAAVGSVRNPALGSESPVQSQRPSQTVSNDVVRIAVSRAVEMPVANVPTADARAFVPALRAPTTNNQTSPLPTIAGNSVTLVTQSNSATTGTVRIAENPAQVGPVDDSATGSKTDAAPLVNTIESQRARLSRVVLGAVGVLVLAGVVALLFVFAAGRQVEFEMTLACGDEGHEETVTLTFDKNEQCVLLHESKPVLETRGAEGDLPCIVVRSLGGPQLCPGTSAQVRLNGESVTARRRIRIGDTIEAHISDRCARVVFHGGNFVSSDVPANALQSATIN